MDPCDLSLTRGVTCLLRLSLLGCIPAKLSSTVLANVAPSLFKLAVLRTVTSTTVHVAPMLTAHRPSTHGPRRPATRILTQLTPPTSVPAHHQHHHPILTHLINRLPIPRNLALMVSRLLPSIHLTYARLTSLFLCAHVQPHRLRVRVYQQQQTNEMLQRRLPRLNCSRGLQPTKRNGIKQRPHSTAP
ncbi:hypothetical protein BCR44DRAFT_275793 [Catenaria anguillulae PL171]|uniref:Uncharacterized protein n=1 Tax=Catenaria anguillulae PL171 TaxID=765915 RepID=A0A1Y2H9K3_9FUNG|nr:hypothetical protein BCR44DRAFT_275793 [Catenaria anguillulae PL171]